MSGPDHKAPISRTLNIGLLHYSCAPVVGGVEEVMEQQARSLKRSGHLVHIIAGMGEAGERYASRTIEPLLASKNKEVMDIHEGSKTGGDQSRLESITDRVYAILREWSKGLDALLAHNVLHMPFNLPLTLALRRLAEAGEGPAIVSWAHDSPYFQESVPDYLHSPPWDVLGIPHRNIHYVTISQSRRLSFQRLNPHFSFKMIPNGIDPVGFFYLNSQTNTLCRELDLFKRDMVVVQPSRITPRKNLELSIHIIRGIKLLGYNVLFILTGAYDPHEKKAVSYYRRLRYWVKELDLEENIAILAEYRFQDGTKLVLDRIFMRDLYLISDLLLMTSKDEGFGLPLLEAGMIKLPIACTNIPPFRELGESPCFFGLDDHPKSIANRVVEYLEKNDTHRMYRRVISRHLLDRICKDEILPFLGTIINEDK